MHKEVIGLGILTKIFDFFKPRAAPDIEKDSAPVVSYAESPPLYPFEQFTLSTDRISIIRDVRKLVKEETRFKMTNMRLAADATKGGFKILVQGSQAYKQHMRRLGRSINTRVPGANRAQQIIDDFLRRTKLQAKAESHARALTTDGDLFLNPVVDLGAGLILDIRRAPALTVKRNSDEYGEFPDVERAFSQIDPKTQIHTLLEVGPPKVSRIDFALYQMNHTRWLEDETELYGRSHYASARSTYHVLKKMEWAAAIRREYRSVMKYNHKLPDNTQPAQVEEYMRKNRLIDDKGRPTRNAHLLTDFVGTVDVKAVDGDGKLGEMDDIKYFDDLLWVDLGVPKALLTSGKDVNRDVLKVQYPSYLKLLDSITDKLEYGDSGAFSGYRALVDLQLLLQGINPDSIVYDIVWSRKVAETANERMEFVQAGRGKGGGDVLFTRAKAIQLIAEDADIEDPLEMAAQVEEELAQTSQVKKSSKIEEESITDVMEEDRERFGTIENQAQKATLDFFKKVYRSMLDNQNEIIDAVLLDDSDDDDDDSDDGDNDDSFDEAWDENEDAYRTRLVKLMTKVGILGAEKAKELIEDLEEDNQGDNPAKLKISIVRQDIYDDLLNRSSERIVRIKETTRKKIREILAEGFDENIGWAELMKRIEPIIIDPVRAEMIARTELSWSYLEMQKRVYKNAGFEKIEWHTVVDQRTCGICRERNGKVYPIDDHPPAPAHPRCRCSFLPAE
jgi:SPP1 gp7 family putative phage head morphogenesis protein